MAGYVKELGKNTGSVSASTLVVTLGATASTGNLVVARVVGDSARIVSSVADSRGNTWAVDVSNATAPKSNICSTGQNVAALQSGDTVTFTFSAACTQKCAIVDEFSGTDVSSTRLDKTATGTATTTNRSGGTTATTTQANELVVGCFALGGAETSFTHGTGYSDFTTTFLVAIGTTVEGEFQIVSATAAYNPTATGGLSLSSNGVTATYKATAAAVASLAPDNRLVRRNSLLRR